MDFKDQSKQLAERVSNLKEQIFTEEATKNAFSNNIGQLSLLVIDLLKSYINGNKPLSEKARELLLMLGKELDRRKVCKEPMSEIECLYGTVLWLIENSPNNEQAARI